MMTIPQEIIRIVGKYDANRESYKSPKFSELMLRKEFLDPFFAALGWDMENRSEWAEAYKDVIHGDAIKFEGSTKAPDYCFRIGGTRKFFVEAKKPSVDINNDPSPAFQLRRYAWSSKLPLSILTNFEEIAVYDCRIKPANTDKASTGRIKVLPYTEYSGKWDEIASIFSREAVLKGSFDKYAEASKGKKGTAEVDDAFLMEIESWRSLLANNLAIRNPRLTQRELNFAVQRTIDRIIFLRICEDRRIEPEGQLHGLMSSTGIYGRLVELYRQADKRYNSGLFHFQEEVGRVEAFDRLTPGLMIEDKVLKEILRNLYYPNSPYEFSVLPADILGQVYEQFLGKVIRLTAGHQARVEDKPEVKKAGGVFYTPTYIVDYIVRNTVGRLLDGKTPNDTAKIKILDPACGSGSFLIGAYQLLLDWHRNWYVSNGKEKWAKGKYPALYQREGGEWQLTTSKRKEILLNNIYGVDIDPQAVEVTKLSLLLKVLEVTTQFELFKEHALPDLGSNIKCGNSLIGSDFYENQQFSFMNEDEHLRINAFDWDKEFPRIFSGPNPGFDAVIGNPPYGASFLEQDKLYIKKKYKHQNYQLDSYLIFLEISLNNLLNSNGFWGMIIPNPWLTNLLQKNIRAFTFENSRIIEIVHFKFKVFAKATVDTQVIILQKAFPEKWQVQVKIIESINYFNSNLNRHCIVISHDQDRWRKGNGEVINIFLRNKDLSLVNKCTQNSVALGDIYAINVGIKPYQKGKGNPPQTKETVENRIFDSDVKINSAYRKYIRGKDIKRYLVNPLEERYIKFGPWLAEPRPIIDFNSSEKIVIRQTGDSLVGALDSNQYLCLNNLHVLLSNNSKYNIKYVLGIVNSLLLNWYYHTLNPEEGEALAEVKKTNVEKLPIHIINFSNLSEKARHDRLVQLVELMISFHKQLPSVRTDHEKTALKRQIDSTDNQIDQLVYELYDLSDEDINIVEKSISKA